MIRLILYAVLVLLFCVGVIVLCTVTLSKSQEMTVGLTVLASVLITNVLSWTEKD